MTTFKAFISNLIISNLWSIILVLITAGICADLLEHDASFFIFFSWIMNGIISFFIHLFLFTPGVIIHKKYQNDSNTLQAFKSLYPLLLIPLSLYIAIMSLIMSETSAEPHEFGIITFIGTSLMLMHSISLYTFIHQNFKNEDYEKVNQ